MLPSDGGFKIHTVSARYEGSNDVEVAMGRGSGELEGDVTDMNGSKTSSAWMRPGLLG